jgi:SAM-dependent methyltransferase
MRPKTRAELLPVEARSDTMSTIYSGAQKDRVTETSFLEKRIEINKSYSTADFDGWLFKHLAVRSGDDVLDVGCGTGAQTIRFSRDVMPGGSVSALDISGPSVQLLKSRLDQDARVEAVVADMAELEKLIKSTFSVKRYDLAHSSYALYYSPKRLAVLDVMRTSLKPGGRCAVFTPIAPHGLVELASRFTSVPDAVHDSLDFGERILKPYFDTHFLRVDVRIFRNQVILPSVDLLIDFYRQTTYHDPAAEAPMRAVAEQAIARSGTYSYAKNGYLIIGHA